MNREIASACIGLMVAFLILLLMLMIGGCATTYHLTADPTTGKVTNLEIKSRREFENGLAVKYNRETGSFEFIAGSVTNGISPLETAAAQLLLMMPSLLNPTVRPVPLQPEN